MAIDVAFTNGPPQLSSQWEFKLILDWYATNKRTMGTDEFSIRVKSVSLPTMSLEHESHPTGLKYYSGVTHVDTITIEVEERYDFAVYDTLMKLMDGVYDARARTFRNIDDNMLLEAYLNFYTGIPWLTVMPQALQAESHNVVKTFNFHRMRIKEVSEMNPSYEDGSPLTHTVTFTVEDIEPIDNSDGLLSSTNYLSS